MRLGAWSGAAESPYATGDYRKQQRDGDAAVGGLDLTRCGRYDSTGPKNNGCLWQVRMRSCVVQPDLATVVFLVCFILITGSGMAQGTRQMVESDQYGVASQVGFSQLKAQGASNANMMFTANLALSDERSKPDVLSDTRSQKNVHRQVENAAVAGCQEDMTKSKQMERHNRKLTDAAPVMSNKDSYPSFIWCIAKPGANVYALQTALNWTCSKRGGNINCSPILAGGVCYLPNTIQTHSSWAFNAYFYNNPTEYDSCDFNGTAILAYTDLSTQSCLFQGTSSAIVQGAAHMEAAPAFQLVTTALLLTYLIAQHAL